MKHSKPMTASEVDLRQAAARAMVEKYRQNLDERMRYAWTGKSTIQLEAEQGLIIEGQVNEQN